MDDKPLPPRTLSSLSENLEAALERVRSVQGVGGNLYRAVEVTLSPDGRLARVGKIWHRDLEHVRRFGHALAADTTGMQVQVTDSRGQVLETISPPARDAEPRGWANWTTDPVPAAPPRPPQPRRRPRPLPEVWPKPAQPPAQASAKPPAQAPAKSAAPAIAPPVIEQVVPASNPADVAVGSTPLPEPPEARWNAPTHCAPGRIELGPRAAARTG